MKKTLYHFTSYTHMLEIIASGKIKCTCSNLLEPVNLRIVDGQAVSDTDYYKPVVWLTSKPSPERLGVDNLAFPEPEYDKRRIRFEINTAMLNIRKWEPWADENGIVPAWKAALIKGMDYKTWYILEAEIPISAVSKIIDLFSQVEIIGYKG